MLNPVACLSGMGLPIMAGKGVVRVMLNETIKNARKAKGMSQEEMAVQLNVVRQTVSKWETGLSVPDADELLRISALLDVSVNDLLGLSRPNDAAEDLAGELARVNEQLAAKKQEENLYRQANKKRGLILLLSFAALLIALRMENQLVSIFLVGGCILTALVILYQNLALLTRVTTADMRIGTLKVATIFNFVILVFALVIAALDRGAVIELAEAEGRLLAMGIVCAVILFGGVISPKLPFNRHTGLRLPWTVQDEDTWNVAHRIIGYISLPTVLLYLAAAFTISDFEAVTVAAMLLWIGVPGLLSLAFWWKKYRGKA